MATSSIPGPTLHRIDDPPDSAGDVESPSHPALTGFWPSEQRAILEYRSALRCALNRRVTIEESVLCWEKGPAIGWRQDKMHVDGQRQVAEIRKHKFLLSQQAKNDVGWDDAALDWVSKHAARWREWWETQPDALPDLGAHVRPALSDDREIGSV